MFGCPFQIRYLNNFSNSLILLERSFILTFSMAYLAFLYFSTLLWSLEPERLPTTFLIPPFLLLTQKMWFPSCPDRQNYLRFSKSHTYSKLHAHHYPDIFMFPNIALTTVSHVHRHIQIFLLNCELFLPKRHLSGSTMINRR